MVGKGFLNCHKMNEILTRTVDIVKNLSSFSKLDLPRCQHEHEEGRVESVIFEMEVKSSGTNDKTGR